MKKTVVINVVGLTQRLIDANMPFVQAFQKKGNSAVITPMIPAVTCSVQATYLTGKWPSEHGIVGNGWYFAEECEIKFWRQSNKLVEAEKIWEDLRRRDPGFTCANMFWWYNMYSTADYSVTPRPNYLADGRKIPDVYSHPADLRDYLQGKLGTFPLFDFWGPRTSIRSSRWIADATLATDLKYDPTLTLVYLPHLDYNLQRHGLDMGKIAGDLAEIDTVIKDLVTHFEARKANVILLSEYGITSVSRPVHLNRVLRENGYLNVRIERGLELLDAGASTAFAVADHQVAHVYLNDPDVEEAVTRLLQSVPGVAEVLDRKAQKTANLNHRRSGDLVVLAKPDSWFTYYFWLDDSKAPDYARMVDIHKKPGYDPVEMLTDPKDPWVTAKVIWKLLKKKSGFRTVMDIIPLKAELVKGSHGLVPESQADFPILISNRPKEVGPRVLEAVEVRQVLEDHILEA